VRDVNGNLAQAFLTGFFGDSINKELYGYYKNGELKAVLVCYWDETAQLYKFVISKVASESLTVAFDEVDIGNLGAVTAIDTPVTGQITHEAAALSA